jgi:hypothetical protein
MCTHKQKICNVISFDRIANMSSRLEVRPHSTDTMNNAKFVHVPWVAMDDEANSATNFLVAVSRSSGNAPRIAMATPRSAIQCNSKLTELKTETTETHMDCPYSTDTANIIHNAARNNINDDAYMAWQTLLIFIVC